jgi:hypothetical protein
MVSKRGAINGFLRSGKEIAGALRLSPERAGAGSRRFQKTDSIRLKT